MQNFKATIARSIPKEESKFEYDRTQKQVKDIGVKDIKVEQ